MEAIKRERDEILQKLEFDQNESFNHSFLYSENGVKRRLDEIEISVTGGFKLLLNDPGDEHFKQKNELDF